MIEAILGLVIFGIVVTLYIDYQADKRFKISPKTSLLIFDLIMLFCICTANIYGIPKET